MSTRFPEEYKMTIWLAIHLASGLAESDTNLRISLVANEMMLGGLELLSHEVGIELARASLSYQRDADAEAKMGEKEYALGRDPGLLDDAVGGSSGSSGSNVQVDVEGMQRGSKSFLARRSERMSKAAKRKGEVATRNSVILVDGYQIWFADSCAQVRPMRWADMYDDEDC